eukprot:GHRR01028839.1.p1 GENE.GHRR01028839.1~~GHRR01028839.1.p1  ORF type:complete len:366 (+),score=108.16 GHRR01028839.1:992-2089(+)
MLADRCVTNPCPDPSDQCCALGPNAAACSAQSTCQVSQTCLPVQDECAVLNNADCQSAAFCRWRLITAPAGNGTLNGTVIGTNPNATYTNSTATNRTSVSTKGRHLLQAGSMPAPPKSTGAASADNGPPGSLQTGVCVMDASKHPCFAAADAQTCFSLTDITGRPRCYAQGTCLNVCTKCADCLNATSTSLAAIFNQLTGPDAADAGKMSQAFSTWCNQQNVGSAICSSIASGIAFSPNGNLARRPGKLCTLAGMCPAGCTVPTKLADGTIAKQPVDLCSSDGTATGTPVPAPIKASGQACLVDRDCNATSGAWCSFNYSAPPVSSCLEVALAPTLGRVQAMNQHVLQLGCAKCAHGLHAQHLSK